MRISTLVRLSPATLLALLACGDDVGFDSSDLETGASASVQRLPGPPAVDVDGDGYDTDTDCDDGNALVNPGAAESDNLTDDDCDGWVDEDFVAVGDVVVTEVNRRSYIGGAVIQNNASWVEVYNTSDRTIDLSNWNISRGPTANNEITLDPSAAPILAAGEYAVFCDSDDYEASVAAYPLDCDYVWGDETQPSTYSGVYHDNTWFMRRDQDTFALYINGDSSTGTEIDSLTYYYDAVNGYWPRDVRFSMSLDPNYHDGVLNDERTAWCSTNASATTGKGVASNTWRWHDTSGTTRDEFGTPGAANYDCPVDPDLDGDGYAGDVDCDDADSAVNPGATEVCDGIDNDCDGNVDNAGGYADTDGDGYGDPDAPGGCSGSGTYVLDNTDCDDTNAGANPAATESDNLVDDDCDDWVDEDFVSAGDVVVSEINRRSMIGTAGVKNNASWVEVYNASTRTVDLSNWYFARGTSASGNGVYVDPQAAPVLAAGEYAVFCDSNDYEGSTAAYPLACDYIWGDEAEAATFVGTYHDNTFYIRRDADTISLYLNGDFTTGTLIDAVTYTVSWTNAVSISMTLDPDLLDSTSNDSASAWCATNDGVKTTSYRWYDTPATASDEYGTPGVAGYDCASDLDGDGSPDSLDCDDTDATVYPGAPELCDGLDNDCDSTIDEGLGTTTYYADTDGDTYGDPANSTLACSLPTGYTTDNTDCDDTEASANPGETEVCGDGIDNDCDPDPVACEFSGSQEIKADYDFRAYGTAANWAVGTAVANKGDFNGDGYDDVIVGQGFWDTSPTTDNGRVNLWYGPVDTSDSISTADLTIDGDTTRNSDQFGSTAVFAGDIDGDGLDDLLAASYRSHTDDRGTAYLFYGGNTSTSITGADASFSWSVASTTAYAGFGLAGGDFDGDLASDVFVSAYGYSGGASGGGAVGYWDSAAVGGTEYLDTTSTALIRSTTAGENVGYSISTGDLDGDGQSDLLVGAPSASSTTASGSVYVFLGASGLSGTVAPSAADGVLTGTTAADRLGLQVAFLGDADGDGNADFAVSADKSDLAATDAGAVYVVGTVPAGSSTVAASADTTFTGEAASDFFGRSVAGVGDQNGDGTAEIMVGATAYDAGGLSGSGAVYYWYGPYATGTVAASTYDARWTGANTSDAVGAQLAGGGDVNADGLADWMSAATSWDGFGYLNSGGSWLYYGQAE